MSINAIVSAVSLAAKQMTDENGFPVSCEEQIVGTLKLDGRERGQKLFTFYEPFPLDVALLKDRQIWGSASSIILGQTEIAKRRGYTEIVFTVESIGAVIELEEKRKETQACDH